MSAPPVFVIGAGAGMGAAIARRFAREGHPVGLVARSDATVDATAATIHDQGTSAVATALADAGDPAAVQAAVAGLQQRLGDPGVLVYNVSALQMVPPSELTWETLRDTLAYNVGGAVTAVNAVLPSMRAAGEGTILLTGGGLALFPSADLAALSIGKAAIRAYALTLFDELRPAGIHAAMVTIAGLVASGGPFDPDRIADTYLELYRQAPAERVAEIIFDGS